MKITELTIDGVFEIETRIFPDARGLFLESFRADQLEQAIGHSFDLRQANTSVSQKGVLRGIHFADVPRGQAKYVTVPRGAILDFIVDLRVGSPTFGQTVTVEVNDTKRNSVYLAEGLGHAFLALEDNTVVNYLVSDIYRPEREHGINPLDSEIQLPIPANFGTLNISDKDMAAPSLAELKMNDRLPTWEASQELYSDFPKREA